MLWRNRNQSFAKTYDDATNVPPISPRLTIQLHNAQGTCTLENKIAGSKCLPKTCHEHHARETTESGLVIIILAIVNCGWWCWCWAIVLPELILFCPVIITNMVILGYGLVRSFMVRKGKKNADVQKIDQSVRSLSPFLHLPLHAPKLSLSEPVRNPDS